jgi:hypothetical protein|tara:strand:- start:197 stop:538 length:342 start_codon:yes stop_codon:yes gene_type:complete
MANGEMVEIEKRLERMHLALKRQEKELESWRHRSTRIPNWIRNSGVALFLAIFAQTMAAVWWASSITNTQMNIISDVKTNTEYRITSTDRYNEIMIELTKLQVMMETHFNLKD